jgi:hypothetical protein
MAKKRKFRSRTQIPDIAALEGALVRITRAQAVALIADRMPRSTNERQRRNCVQQSFGRYVGSAGLQRGADGRYELADVLEWAIERWPLLDLSDLRSRMKPRESTGRAAVILPRLSAQARIISLPNTLDECHLAIRVYDGELVRLNEVVEQLKKEIESLRPDAEATRRRRKQGKGTGGIRHPSR